MPLRARLAAWIDRTFWPGLDDRQPCLSVAEVVVLMDPGGAPWATPEDMREIVAASYRRHVARRARVSLC